jgi:galactokinase
MTEKLAGQEVSSASRVQREAQRLREEFQKLYAQEARIFRAPGRVNLIGEHTDYNEGFVMPVAMDLYTWVAAAARKDARVQVYSQNLRERAEMDLQHLNLQVQSIGAPTSWEWRRVCASPARKSAARICWWREKFRWVQGFPLRRR